MAAASASGVFVPPKETEVPLTFSNIYKLTSFCLVTNAMYPAGPHKGWRRIFWTTIFIFLGSNLLICFYGFYVNLVAGNIGEVARQVALVIALILMMQKMWLSMLKKNEFESIMNEMNKDYIEYFHASEKYKQAYEALIRECIKGQFLWLFISSSVALAFPIISSVKMVYYASNHYDHKKYMLYEISIPFFDDIKYDAPLFHISFLYSSVVTWFCITNFTGFDATYVIATLHGSGRLKIMTMRLADLFESNLNPEEILPRLRVIVQYHQDIYRYAEKLQNFYAAWFTGNVGLSSIQICLTLYRMTEALDENEIDVEFIIFTVGSIIQIYIPCRYGAILSDAFSDAAVGIYNCGWENSLDKKICFIINFMITRAQKPMKFETAFVCFMDMNSFTSIVNSSYSYFTLLRTKN